jgi:hypothetical protein
MLTALIERPRRLVYLSSSMHRGGTSSLRDIDWSERRWNRSQAYSDSKLYLTALASATCGITKTSNDAKSKRPTPICSSRCPCRANVFTSHCLSRDVRELLIRVVGDLQNERSD